MSVSRLLSLVIFAASTPVILAAIFLASPGLHVTWPLAGGALAFALLAACVIAMLTDWLSRRVIEMELQRFCNHVSVPPSSVASAGSSCRSWIHPLYDAFDLRLSNMQQQADDTASLHRREQKVDRSRTQTQRRYLQAMVDTVHDGVIITDAFNELVTANAAAARLLRFDLDAAAGQPIDTLMQDAALIELIKRVRRSGLTYPQRQEHTVHTDGRDHHYELSVACVVNAHDEIDGVVTILHDVTRCHELAEMKSDFVCGISHELRTPLSSIKAYIEMLVDGEADSEAGRTEFYNIIHAETNRLSRLIDNMLNISRLESGVVKAQRDTIAVGDVIRDTVDIMHPQARARHVSVRVSRAPDDAVVHVDGDMLQQALINLFSNAIKYTPAGGSIRIETQVDPQQNLVHVRVTDSGIGIPAESLPYLFDKFYRVPQHKRLAKGTGLGLPLVKHIVETVHHGHVRVISSAGRGSTFIVSLPQARVACSADSPPELVSAIGDTWS